MNRTSFARSDLRDVNAFDTVFSNANFSAADLTNATFVGTYFDGSAFKGAHSRNQLLRRGDEPREGPDTGSAQYRLRG